MAIDLEHFPTSEAAIRMMERISPIYGKSYVGKWIFQIMGLEMDEARALFLALRDEAFPARTAWTIDMWERRYAIIPQPGETLEERRRNIKMKQSAFLPMNPARMEEIVSGMTGGSAAITENVDDYTFRVTINGPAKGTNTLPAVKEIQKRKPSHQNFDFSVVMRPDEPSTLRLGGTMSAAATLPAPEQQDRFHFRHTLRLGGTMSAITTIPIPEQRDRFAAQAPLRVGGRLAARARIPVPAAETS